MGAGRLRNARPSMTTHLPGTAMLRLPMFGFTCFSFLMLLVIVAIAVWLVFRSGEKGSTRLSGCAGCAIGFALLAIAGLGALGCVAVAVITAPDEMVRHGPFRKFEFHWPKDGKRDDREGEGRTGRFEAPGEPGRSGDPDEASSNDKYPARLSLTLRPGSDVGEIAGEISEWLREETEGDLDVHIRNDRDDGHEVTRLDFRLPIPRQELEKLRDDLRREMPRLRLPESVEIEVRDD
jgi:hypothetical protein